MGTRTARRPRKTPATEAGFRSEEEMHEVLDRLLELVDGDEKIGPLLRAAGLRLRLECPDFDVALNVVSSDDLDHCVRWSWGKVDWRPKLHLVMDSEMANGFLQGRESIPIAIARGKVRCTGESRYALLYLPATGLLVEPYRKLIRRDYPHLERRAPIDLAVRGA